MKLPNEVPVMTLPNATLFPQYLLPLYIYEPRYRKMLVDALNGNRMFSVAMQRPGRSRETPSPVAGLGLIRVSVGHQDGTSHLVLQGIARVELDRLSRAARQHDYSTRCGRESAVANLMGDLVDELASRCLQSVLTAWGRHRR